MRRGALTWRGAQEVRESVLLSSPTLELVAGSEMQQVARAKDRVGVAGGCGEPRRK